MSFATEINAVQYRAMVERCAAVEADCDVLRKRLDSAVRKIVALESVKSEPVRMPVQWQPFPDGSISQACAWAIKQGWISEYYVSGYVTNEEIAITNGRALEETRELMLRNLINELLARVIVQEQRPERRTNGVVVNARVVVGKIDA
jgi:hypothetical protein